MSKRTQAVLDTFAGLVDQRRTSRHSTTPKPDGSVNFKELVRGHQTRKEVAQRFYSSLVLKKLRAIDVEQAEPYGDIWLKRGERFDTFTRAWGEERVALLFSYFSLFSFCLLKGFFGLLSRKMFQFFWMFVWVVLFFVFVDSTV